ncbi:MarR family winged helix-turn-helix transcriptional regulator [Sinomonas sp. G460-2]|uniref:MarR family winged helix-turn-helix transcriptional regulator n=1 Tax=Sinomonas sp. G460-2 TaxID=3393464 RepID=UPI0039F0554E
MKLFLHWMNKMGEDVDEQGRRLQTLDELLRVAIEMRRHIDEVGDQFGLSGPQVRLLLALDHPLRMNAAAEATACEPPHVTILAEQMERSGLLVRTRDPADRRARLLVLTDAGVRRREEVIPALLENAPVVSVLDLEACIGLTQHLRTGRGVSAAAGPGSDG